MEFVYMCLLEIALALRHLHTAKIAHCDLKPGNVLLRSSPRDPRSFVCKLGDFGCVLGSVLVVLLALACSPGALGYLAGQGYLQDCSPLPF